MERNDDELENEYFKSERLIYRPHHVDDLQTMVKLRNEKSMRKWFYFQEPDCLTDQFALDTITESQAVWTKKVNILEDNCFLAVISRGIGEMIGTVGIANRIRPEVHLNGLEIGYSIGELHQGNGFATEAAKAALRWAFSQFCMINTYPKIEAHIEHENWASRKVAEKAGFTFNRKEEYVTVYSIESCFSHIE